MKRFGLYILFIALTIVIPTHTVAEETIYNNYEISGAGTATQGTYLVQVSVNSKKKSIDDADLKKAAVHGVLFRGFANAQRRQHQRPLAGNADNEYQHKDFYLDFFGKEGTAVNYASIVPGSRSITKSGKTYSIKATISVNKEDLLKYLSDNGVVSSLNTAF